MVKKFLDLARKVRSRLTSSFLKKSSKSITESFYGYDDITLKLYLDVIESNDFSKIQITGEKNLAKCTEVWEEIIKTNAEKNKDFQYSSFVGLQQQQAVYVSEYIAVKAFLTKLTFTKPSQAKEEIKYLRRKGYNIVTDQTSEMYEKSLINALRRSDNLITKTKMKENEIKDFLISNGRGKGNKTSLEEILGHLSAGIGYSIDQSLTLARYNVYREILKAKNGRQRGNKQAGRTT